MRWHRGRHTQSVNSFTIGLNRWKFHRRQRWGDCIHRTLQKGLSYPTLFPVSPKILSWCRIRFHPSISLFYEGLITRQPRVPVKGWTSPKVSGTDLTRLHFFRSNQGRCRASSGYFPTRASRRIRSWARRSVSRARGLGSRRGSMWVSARWRRLFSTHTKTGNETSWKEESFNQLTSTGNWVPPLFSLPESKLMSKTGKARPPEPFQSIKETWTQKGRRYTSLSLRMVFSNKTPDIPWILSCVLYYL